MRPPASPPSTASTRWGRWCRRGSLVLCVAATSAGAVTAQDVVQPGDSAPPMPDSASALAPAPASGGGLPVLLTVALGYGQRLDGCVACVAPENTTSFTGHVALAKPLAGSLAIGLEGSVWRRGHPGPPGAPDSLGVPVPTTLSNTLGNASLVFSYQLWRVFVRAGGGVAWGSQDLAAEEAPSIERASGMGLGYTVGAGVTLPLAGPVSLAFFGNWNAGFYDLASPTRVVARGAEHSYYEVGVGLTLR